MHIAVADMPGADAADVGRVSAAFDKTGRAKVVAVDTNLPQAVIRLALEAAGSLGAVSVVQVVSVPKLDRIAGLVASCDWLIMNEAEHRAYTPGTLVPRGIVVTRGAAGIDVVDPATAETRRFRAFDASVVDENGAGDAFTGGFCAKMAEAATMAEAVVFGAAAAAVTVSSVGTVPPSVTRATVEERIERSRSWKSSSR
jgi:sugar/nucleoside kinase (ribokinase family)